MTVQLCGLVIHLVERCSELGTTLTPSHRQVVAAAVLKVGSASPDHALLTLADMGGELGTRLVQRALQALEVPPEDIQCYGKAALMGTGVPLEYGAALLHPRLGRAVRACLPGANTIMPSVAKRGAPGASIDIPLHGVTDMWSFDHFDTVSLTVADAPAPDEIVVAVALADRGRPLARIRPV